MKEYFKTDAKQFAFRPKAFNEAPRQQIIRLKVEVALTGDSKDYGTVRLDQNRIFVFYRNSDTSAAYGQYLTGKGGYNYMGLIDLSKKTLTGIKPPKTYPSGQREKADQYAVTPAFCILENETIVIAADYSGYLNACVLNGDTWEFIEPNISIALTNNDVLRGGIIAGSGFYEYSKEGGLKPSSIDVNILKAVTTKNVLQKAEGSQASAPLLGGKSIRGAFPAVNYKKGWIEGNTHYLFDGDALIVTEFVQDNVIEIKE